MGGNSHIILKFLMLFLLLASRNESPVRAENLSAQTWVGSKYEIECTMCSACDNPCNTPSPPPPSPPPPAATTTVNYPPPPSPPYYYSPPPPQPIYTYYSPPPPGSGGGGYYKPPQTPPYQTGPAPPPPNPIVSYFPYYYNNPTLPSLSPPFKKIPSSFLIIMTSLFYIFC